MTSIIDRFNALALHDSRLLRISNRRREGSMVDELLLELQVLLPPDARRSAPATLTFVDCAGLDLRIDFWGKRVCGDAIMTAVCEPLSEEAASRLDQNVRRQAIQPFASMLAFSISLCPPGGDLVVIARDFDMQADLTTR